MSYFSQMFPPKPKFTEKDLGDLNGKVYIVTGASSGVGLELASILYSKNARVYIAARSEFKTKAATQTIKARHPASSGQLVFLKLDLSDLASLNDTVEEFLSREDRLDVLFNNAGVMHPPEGSKTAQGHELQLGTNTLGPFLLTKLLTRVLKRTAQRDGESRVVWVASSAAELFSPANGVEMDVIRSRTPKGNVYMYATSKAGLVLNAMKYAELHREDGIVSVAMNPGNLKSDLQRHFSGVITWFFHLMSYHPIFGAYTELFGGLSPEVTVEKSGSWIIPWGRIAVLRQDIQKSSLSTHEGGTGVGEEFWQWCEEQVRPFVQ